MEKRRTKSNKPETVRVRRKSRDIIQELALRKEGKSLSVIAKKFGVSKNTIALDLSKLMEMLPNNSTLEGIDKLKVKILQGTLVKMLEGLNRSDKLEEASLNNIAYALTQVHNALRLEQGKSTSNVSYADSLAALRDAKNELKKLNEINPNPAAPAEDAEFSIPVIVQPEDNTHQSQDG